MKKATVINGKGEPVEIKSDQQQWTAACPDCETVHHFTGFFGNDWVPCRCGCNFTIKKYWINDNKTIEPAL